MVHSQFSGRDHMRIFMAAASVAMLVGCSTTPVNEQTADPVPASRIYQPSLVKKGEADRMNSTVTFTRDSGYFGSGCSHDMYINNVKAFSIRQGEIIRVSLVPGSYFFRLETGAGICPNIATSQSTELKPGAEEAYRILLPSDGNLRLTRVR